jgi:hypothetical protein
VSFISGKGKLGSDDKHRISHLENENAQLRNQWIAFDS